MPVSAQSQLSETEDTKAVIQDVEGLRLELVQRTQDPGSLEVQFDLFVYAQINSDRVQVTWQVGGSSELKSPETQTLNVQSGRTYTVSATVLPRQLGTTDISATVQAFSASGTYLATAKKTFGTYTSGEVYPVSGEYRLAQIANVLRWGSVLGMVVIAGIWLAGFVKARLNVWLHKDELAQMV